MEKVAHLTSVHPRDDIRIFLKECMSLSKIYKVVLVVADGNGNEEKHGIDIYDVGAFSGRLNRMKNAPAQILKQALALNADIYHLHDPELLTIALNLKKSGKKVIFDAHEDVPKQILSKPYLNKWVAKIISILVRIYEQFVCTRLDAVVTATPMIRDKFLKYKSQVIDINNYPLPRELEIINKDWNNIGNQIAYVGGITKIRGIEQVVEAMSLTEVPVRLNLVGKFSEEAVYRRVQELNGWRSINEFGQLGRGEVKTILAHSIAGIVTFLPMPNHIDAQPNKMFEYMSAGIPVIASNYPLWRSIIEGNNCGICVDPLNPQEIANAIDKLVQNKEWARLLGENGKKAIYDKYSWLIEEKKLLQLYQTVLET
ncbi:glycosyltransferase involved in cell wall biosynthesis [Neisseria sp. HSC-16F19]|nr:glycosyltransferase family 4 protein [Neisseria sp. HSC-16F19]MCP2041412.1 glycosyltransferase involved in cell wall biosynthesis [Neisseria sp. HSC-16F19]